MMFKRLLLGGTTTATALALLAAPAQAAPTTSDSVRSVSAPTAASAPASRTAAATTIGWNLDAYGCGFRNGVPAIEVQSAQAKNGPDVNRLVAAHQLQRQRLNGSWATVGVKKFVKKAPVNGVWYYAPGPGSVWSWNLNNYGYGNYRINVNFKYFWGTALMANRNMNTQKTYGVVCQFTP